MKSPFPGMDPYLEKHWGDIHATLMVYTRNQLNEQLPDDLQASVEEDVTIETEEQSRTIYPDVQVVEHPGMPAGESRPANVAVAEPYVVDRVLDPRIHRWVQISQAGNGGRLVTVIEFLSPANKVGLVGQAAYVQKQQELLMVGVNLVEIDLIRGASPTLVIPPHRFPHACRTPYLICITRAARGDRSELYPISLQAPLPNVPIPLRPTDQDVVLRLQPLLDDCYRDGRYHRLDYRSPPIPPLAPADAEWADALLREKGLR